MEKNVLYKNKILGLIGISKKAGKLIAGCEIICDAIRFGKPKVKPYLVLISSDASDNTCKRIRNCCDFYKTDNADIPATSEELGHMIGKKSLIACVAITDKNLAAEIEKVFAESRI